MASRHSASVLERNFIDLVANNLAGEDTGLRDIRDVFLDGEALDTLAPSDSDPELVKGALAIVLAWIRGGFKTLGDAKHNRRGKTQRGDPALIGCKIVHKGHPWEIIGVTFLRGDGKTYCHLRSTTDYKLDHNGQPVWDLDSDWIGNDVLGVALDLEVACND